MTRSSLRRALRLEHLLLDNCLSHRLAAAAGAVEDSVRFHPLRELLQANASDEEWIAELERRGGSEAGWAVITADLRIHTRPHLRQLWESARITTFFCTAKWVAVPLPVQAVRFLTLVPKMIQEFEGTRPGTAFTVSTAGKLRRL